MIDKTNHADRVQSIEAGFRVQLTEIRDTLIKVLGQWDRGRWPGCRCPVCASQVAPSDQDAHAAWHVRNLQ